MSVEHLALGLMDTPNAAVREVLRQFSIDKSEFFERAGPGAGQPARDQRQPESTYDVLAKYGQELVSLARQQKLDRSSAVTPRSAT